MEIHPAELVQFCVSFFPVRLAPEAAILHQAVHHHQMPSVDVLTVIKVVVENHRYRLDVIQNAHHHQNVVIRQVRNLFSIKIFLYSHLHVHNKFIYY